MAGPTVTAQRVQTFRERREAASLSLRDLERITGINRGRLSIIERGVAPTIGEAIAIESALTSAGLPTGAAEDCAHCHGEQGGGPAVHVVLVGVGPRALCVACQNTLTGLGLTIVAERRKVADPRYLAEFHERRRT